MEVSLAGLPEFARAFVHGLPAAEGKTAYVVGLSGQLGAGKTAFVQEVARALGVSAAVTSPTYVIAQRFSIAHGPFRNLVHIDAYRLSPAEKDTFGWSEYMQNPQNLILVEWPERLPVEAGLPGGPDGMRVLEFSASGENTREIIEKHG